MKPRSPSHLVVGLVAIVILGIMPDLRQAASQAPVAQAQVPDEQRVEIVIKNYEFLLDQPKLIELGRDTVIILRNQDIVRHGFTSPMFTGLAVHSEANGVAAYGEGIEGFYLDPGQTLVVRFAALRPGKFSFKCDLHQHMKGELWTLEIPTA